MASPGCFGPQLTASHRPAPALSPWQRIFDPVCGILDLDVDQRGIKGGHWLEAAELKPQRRGGCGGGGGDEVWALTVSSRPGGWQDPGVRHG